MSAYQVYNVVGVVLVIMYQCMSMYDVIYDVICMM